MGNTIRRDDLEALGALADYAGTFMHDCITNTTDGKGHLYKSNPHPKVLIQNAIKSHNDEAGSIPDNELLIHENVPQPSLQPPPLPIIDTQIQSGPLYPPLSDGLYHGWNPPSSSAGRPPIEQLEFKFVDRMVNNYGSVGDVIDHFNDRLDQLEESVKFIRTFITDVRASMTHIKENMAIKKIKNK